MARNTRWITSAKRDAAKMAFAMPWTRGSRRDAFIAKRVATDPARAANA